MSVEAKVILELKTDIKNLRAVNQDLRDGWDKTLEENIILRENPLLECDSEYCKYHCTEKEKCGNKKVQLRRIKFKKGYYTCCVDG